MRQREKIRIIGIGPRGFPHVPGGVETYCSQLYPRLVAMGHEVVVFTRKRYSRDSSTCYQGVQIIPISSPAIESLETLVYTLKSTFLASRLGADIVHFHGIGPSLFVPLAKVLGLRTVIRHVGTDYRRSKWGPLARIVLRFGESIGCRHADAITCVGPHIRSHVQGLFGRTDALYVPNGVPDYRPVGVADAVLALGLTPGAYALSVGRFVPEKNFHILLEAWRGMRGLQDWKLAIVGAANFQSRYGRRLAALTRARDDVILTGARFGDELLQLYSHAGLFVCPSMHEGMSFSLLEAMAHGLRCIASDIPANRALFIGAEHYFDAGDVDSLRACLAKHLGTSPPSFSSEDLVAHVRRDHDWQKIAAAMIELFVFVKNSAKGQRMHKRTAAQSNSV